MKIAILHTSLNALGGAERVVITLAQELQERGHFVKIFCGGYNQPDLKAFVKTRKIPHVQLPINRFYDFSLNYRIAGWLIKNAFNDFDILNIHNFPAYVWAYYAKKFNPSLPKTIWVCNEPPRDLYPVLNKHCLLDAEVRIQYEEDHQQLRAVEHEQKIDRLAVSMLDKIIANSQFTQENIKKIYNRESEVAYFGIAPKIQTGCSPLSEKYILTITRLEWHKNLRNLIRGFQMACSINPEIRLIIIGQGKDEQIIKKFIEDIKMTEKIKMVGFVKEEDLPNWYAGASFIIYLPLDEPLGLIPIEAAYFGKASLVSNHGGPSEIVIHGVNGLMADPLVPEDISQKILTLADANTASKMGREAQHMVDKFSFTKMVDKFERIANDLVSA